MPIGFVLMSHDKYSNERFIGFFQSPSALNEAMYRDYERSFDYLHDFDCTTSIGDYDLPHEQEWDPIDFQEITNYHGVSAGFTFCTYKMVDYLIYLVGTEEMTGAACLNK